MSEPTNATSKRPSKGGFSIWSLLVIMKLLAVWMAVPRRITAPHMPLSAMLFFLCHQMTFWWLIAAAAWLLLGKRKWVTLTFGALIVLVWTPITMVVVEMAFTGNQVNTLGERLVRSTGLGEEYSFVFRSIFTGLGYGD